MQRLILCDKYSYDQFVAPCKLLTQSNESHNLHQKIIGDSLHIKSENLGYELQYKKTNNPLHQSCQANYCCFQIETVFLYLNNKKFLKYNYTLIYTLVPQSTIKSAIMLLGEPTTKSKYLVQCIWEHLGMGITFLGSDWRNQDLLIDYIYMYQPELKYRDIQMCCLCKKQIKKEPISCHNCQIIKYCSQTCYDKHHVHHQTYCQQIDQ